MQKNTLITLLKHIKKDKMSKGVKKIEEGYKLIALAIIFWAISLFLGVTGYYGWQTMDDIVIVVATTTAFVCFGLWAFIVGLFKIE